MGTNKVTRMAIAAATVVLAVWGPLGCQTQQPSSAVQPAVAATQAPAATAAPAQPTPAQPGAVPTQAPSTIKLGLTLPLTGPSAAAAQVSERIVRMSVDDLNASGIKVGGKSYRFELVVVDNRQDAQGSTDAANRLILAEKVKSIFVASNAAAAAAVQTIAEPNKVLTFSSTTADQSLGPKFPLTFGVGFPHTRSRYIAVYDWLAKAHPQVKRVATVLPDSLAGKSGREVLEEVAKAKGIAVVAEEFYPTDLKDAAPLVTRLLRQNPDAVDVGQSAAYGATFMAIVKALAEQGYRKPVYGTYGEPVVLGQAGAAVNGFVFTNLVDMSATTIAPKEKEVIRRYVEKYTATGLAGSAVASYAVFGILSQVMEKAGTVDDAAKLAQTLREGEWDTIWGKKRFGGAKLFGSPAQLDAPVYLTRIEDGKFVTFDVRDVTLP